MERFDERQLRRRLQDFERVWQRVRAAAAPRETARRCGVKLMPRQGCGKQGMRK